jgi:hypothetical protein
MNVSKMVTMIEGIPMGKTWGISPGKAEALKQSWYVCVRRTDAGYEIEAGRFIGSEEAWVAHDNDESLSVGWDLRVRKSASAQEAASIYATAKDRLAGRSGPDVALR